MPRMRSFEVDRNGIVTVSSGCQHEITLIANVDRSMRAALHASMSSGQSLAGKDQVM